MRHALHAPAVFHFHRNHEAFAANGDQFLLHGAAVGKPPQVRAQRLLDGALLLFNLATDTRQFWRGAVVQRAVRQDLVAEVTQQWREVVQGLREFLHCLPLVLNGNRGMQRDLAPLRCTISQQHQIANLGDLKGRALYARLVYQRSWVEQAVEIEVAAYPQISSQLLRQQLLALDPMTVTRGRELHHAGLSKWRTGVESEHQP